MVQISWKQIDDQFFRKAVMTLNASREVDAKVAYRAGRIMAVCQREAVKINKMKQELAKKHQYDPATGKFPSPEVQEACDMEIMEQLLVRKVDVKVHPIDWEEIFGKVPLTGIELVNLEGICENVPSEEEEV